jgi:hypothetical protein
MIPNYVLVELFQNGQANNYRDTTYDLTVDLIIDTKGQDHLDHFKIGGSGIIEIISAETVCLPANVTGFAHVKTSLVDSGLLPLNIGLIDPGWHGRISATLVNFGDGQGKLIQKGDTFLRVTFIEHQGGSSPKPRVVTDLEYIKDKRKKISQNFGETFLGWNRFKQDVLGTLDTKLAASEARVLPTKVAWFVGLVAAALVIVQLAGAYLIAVDPWHWIGRTWDDVPSRIQMEKVNKRSADALALANDAQQKIRQMQTDMQGLLRVSPSHSSKQ